MIPVTNLAMDINDQPVNVTKIDGQDYICLTDMAKSAGSNRALLSWLRTKNTIDFLGLWEQLHNPDFKLHEFVYFKNNAGSNSFNPSLLEWVEKTRASGIVTKRGRYGGTYAHKDIAFEFGTWLSPEFKLLVITEFQRLKSHELEIIEWDSRRYLSRMNYKLHTDAIKEHLIPALAIGSIKQYTYTTEADMINRIVFGQTASEWKKNFPKLATSQKNQPERIGTLAKEATRQYSAIVAAVQAEQDMKDQHLLTE